MRREIKRDGWKLHVLSKTSREKNVPPDISRSLYENLIMKIERVNRYIVSRQNKIDRALTGRPEPAGQMDFRKERFECARTAFSPSYLFISHDCREITFIRNYRGHGSIRYKDLLRSAAQVCVGRGVTRRPGRT